MSVFYMDTSAIAKRYISEIGSSWIQALVDQTAGHQIVFCDLTPVEFASILARQQREKRVTLADVARLEGDYQFHHSHEYWVSHLDGTILTLARQLLLRQTLRTLDAIHLACALETAQSAQLSLTFVSSDKHLLAASVNEGLSTDDPLVSPLIATPSRINL